jgi:DNA polymerase-3 subunit delta
MVAVKAADVDAFVARPEPVRRVVLVFGPDAGLVSERVSAILKASVDDVNDPFALARLEGEDLAGEPARLIEEALTVPLFGARRAVWVKAGSRNIAPSSKPAICGATRPCARCANGPRMRRHCPVTPTAKETGRG